MILSALLLAAALNSTDALVVVLNSKAASSVRKFSEAYEIVAREAREGKPLQQFVIATTTDDQALAQKYLTASRQKIRTLAESKNNPLAWYLLSVEKNDRTCLIKAAEGGNVQALNALGLLSTQEALASTDAGVRATAFSRAYKYFLEAVKKEDVNAYINLGTCYLEGYGCPQDDCLAFLYYKSAADAGHPEGMENLSMCYKLGRGIAKNETLSLEWDVRARAARGNAAADKWLEARK